MPKSTTTIRIQTKVDNVLKEAKTVSLSAVGVENLAKLLDCMHTHFSIIWPYKNHLERTDLSYDSWEVHPGNHLGELLM